MTIEPNARGAMTDLNVTALVRLSLAALAGFKARNCGTLINIGSTLGFHSLPGSALYSATKGYVLNFTRGLQDELAATNIVVQLVLPGATATDLWDISGVPLSALDPAHVMSVDDCVDAALVGLDLGEKITMPSLEDNTLLAQYDASRLALFAASQSSRPASRYGGTVRRMANAR
jgi:short-subunit dehydrogenase